MLAKAAPKWQQIQMEVIEKCELQYPALMQPKLWLYTNISASPLDFLLDKI